MVGPPGGRRRHTGPSVTAAAVTDGARAAREIANLAAGVGIAAPSPWFAVVMQDLDRLGRALGNLDADGQAEASRMLVGLAGAHRAAIERDAVPGVAIYTGGDDVLAFCPPQRALELARQLRDLTTRHVGASGLRDERGAPVTASSAVVFAPVGMGMQAVLTHAREALEEAKTARGHGVSANRDAVAVVGLLGGGVRVRSVQPWSVDPVAQWSMLRPDAAVLSAGLAAQLERDRTELEELAAHATLAPVLRAELERLIGRRGGDPAHAEALLTLARHERHHPDTAGERAWFAPVPAVVLARFLAQKAS
ncbi:Cas10/Cmr2 second palm domain-containing protein [Nocardia sp. NPDC003482]